MTTGSWSVGNSNSNVSGFWATKSWNGANGKYEPWGGGIRPKWNNYSLVHYRWQITVINDGNHEGVGACNDQSSASLKSKCGWNANDDLRLLGKLVEDIRGHSFDLGINIAEAKESYHTILGNLRSIGGALVALKHGQVGDAFHHLGVPERGWRRLRAKDISGRWLEMQYAWRPLVSQSYEAAQALEAVTGPRRYRFSAAIGTKRATYNGSLKPLRYSYPVKVSYSKRLTAELYEEISIGRSLGLVDPAQILWEVVPYSFVVDWFLPIGSYLSVWQTIPSLKGRFMTTERIGQKAGTFTVVDPTYVNRLNGTVMREMWFNLNRSVSTSLTVPLPTFNRVDRALSPKRLLNAVSLIHQALR